MEYILLDSSIIFLSFNESLESFLKYGFMYFSQVCFEVFYTFDAIANKNFISITFSNRLLPVIGDLLIFYFILYLTTKLSY